MSRVLLAAGMGVAVLVVTSCTKAQAKTPGPVPVALSVPEPPLRLNIPVPADPPAPPAAAVEKPTAPPAAPVTRPRPTPTPTPTPTPPPAGEATPPVVQAGGEHEARARERLAVAQRDIAKVQRKSLAPEAQDQFDSAQRFIRMTLDALTARNFVYAAYCADKAATLAALLVKAAVPRRP